MFLKFSYQETFTLEELAYFLPVSSVNLANDCISFPAASNRKVRKKTYSSILFTLQDCQAQMSTVKIDASADFVHSL